MKNYCFLAVSFIFVSCVGQVDKNKLLGRDYRLFEDTPIWGLAKAVMSNDSKEVERIVKLDTVDLNYQESRFGKTLLMLTVINNQYGMCQKLLELGANPNIDDYYDGTSAIIDAAGIYTESRDTTFIKLLLAYGANPNDEETVKIRKGKTGSATPLLNAAQESLEKVKILVDAGAEVNPKNEYRTVSPLNESLIMKRYEISMYLLEKGADYNKPVVHRKTKNSPEGKDIYIQDLLREKLFPLDSEEYRWKMKIIDFLLTKGIDYRKVPIPDFVVRKAKELYPNTWQEFLKKY